MLKKVVNSGTRVQNPTHVFHYGLVRGLELATHAYMLASLMTSFSEEDSQMSTLSRQVQETFLIFSAFTMFVKDIKPGLNETLQHYAQRFLMNPVLEHLFEGVRLYSGIVCLAQTVYSTLTLNPRGVLQGAYGLAVITTPFSEKASEAVKETLEHYNAPPVLIPYTLGVLRLGLNSGIPYLITAYIPENDHAILTQVEAKEPSIPPLDLDQKKQAFRKSVLQSLQKMCEQNDKAECFFHPESTNEKLVINIPIRHLKSARVDVPYLDDQTVRILTDLGSSLHKEAKVFVYIEGLSYRMDISLNMQNSFLTDLYKKTTAHVEMPDGTTQPVTLSGAHQLIFEYANFNLPKLPANVYILPGEFVEGALRETSRNLVFDEYIPNFNALGDQINFAGEHNHSYLQSHTSEACQKVLCDGSNLLFMSEAAYPVWLERDHALYRDWDARHRLEGPEIVYVNIRGYNHFRRDEDFYSKGEISQSILHVFSKASPQVSGSDGAPTPVMSLRTSSEYKSFLYKLNQWRSICEFSFNTAEKLSGYLHNDVFRPVNPDLYSSRLFIRLLGEQAQKVEECYRLKKMPDLLNVKK